MQSRSTAYSQVGLNPVLYIVCTCCVIESVAWGLVAFWWQDFVLQYAQLLHAHLLKVAPQCCAFVLYTGTELLRGILHKLCSRYICTTTIYMWQPEYQVCCHDNLSISCVVMTTWVPAHLSWVNAHTHTRKHENILLLCSVVADWIPSALNQSARIQWRHSWLILSATRS